MILLTGCNVHTVQPLTEPTPAIDPKLIEAVIQIESGGDPLAKSPKGAIGLMQIMPSTARMLGYHPIQMWHPKTNVEAGTKLLILLKEEHGNIHAALRSYYCGNSHNRSMCYRYANKVMKAYKGENNANVTYRSRIRSTGTDVQEQPTTIRHTYPFANFEH